MASPRLSRSPFVFFFVSGASALVLEVVWLEALGRIFGSTAEAAATTVAAFFLGLAVGAQWGGRLSRRVGRPLLAYGVLEIVVGLGALLTLLLLPLEDALYARFALQGSGALQDAWRLALAFVVLAPATIAMGATWPLLVESLARDGRSAAKSGALLQAFNTLGAALGALLAGFVLPPQIGLTRTLWVAAAASLVVGVLAVLTDRRPRPAPIVAEGPPPPVAQGARALAFLSGLLGLALQVLFVRAFSLALPASMQVFSLVLVVWLLALSLGAFLARRLVASTLAPRSVLSGLLAVGGLLVATSVFILMALTDGLRPPPPELAWWSYLGDVGVSALLVLLPPITVLGAFFPYLLRLLEREHPGRAAGSLLAWNTGGAILGALAGGFVLLPVLGLWTSVRLLALVATLTALLLARGGRRRASVVASVAIVLVAATLPIPTPVVRLREGERLLWLREGSAGSVAVVGSDDAKRLVFDNVFTLGGTHDTRWEALQAHLPLLLHPNPERVFILGLGTGITAGGAVDLPMQSLEVAELVPEVIEAAREHFGPWTNGLFLDPRVRIVADDARHRLRHGTEPLDVVIGDLFFPWQPGTAYLYTREHLETVRERLAPGGLFAQWLPCYQLGMEELRGILLTFVEVFPRVTLWRGDFFADRPILAVVGHKDERPLDPEALVDRARLLIAGRGSDLARDAATVPFHLYVGNLTEAAVVLDGARAIVDDLPWIQWTAPRSERIHRMEGAPVAVRGRLLAFEKAVREASPANRDPYLARLDNDQRRYVKAGLILRAMALSRKTFDLSAQHDARLAYLRLVPAEVRPPLDAWIE